MSVPSGTCSVSMPIASDQLHCSTLLCVSAHWNLPGASAHWNLARCQCQSCQRKPVPQKITPNSPLEVAASRIQKTTPDPQTISWFASKADPKHVFISCLHRGSFLSGEVYEPPGERQRLLICLQQAHRVPWIVCSSPYSPVALQQARLRAQGP